MEVRAEVEGLDELQRAMGELVGIGQSREFEQAAAQAAERIILPRAQSRAAGLGRMQARAAEGIELDGDVIRYGGGEPFELGAEFGAAHNQPRSTPRGVMRGWNQFLPYRGGDGYFLGMTIVDDIDAVVDEIDAGFDPVFARLFD